MDASFAVGPPPDGPTLVLEWTRFANPPPIADDALFKASQNEVSPRGSYVSGLEYVRTAFESCMEEWLRQNPTASPDDEDRATILYEGQEYGFGYSQFSH